MVGHADAHREPTVLCSDGILLVNLGSAQCTLKLKAILFQKNQPLSLSLSKGAWLEKVHTFLGCVGVLVRHADAHREPTSLSSDGVLLVNLGPAQYTMNLKAVFVQTNQPLSLLLSKEGWLDGIVTYIPRIWWSFGLAC